MSLSPASLILFVHVSFGSAEVDSPVSDEVTSDVLESPEDVSEGTTPLVVVDVGSMDSGAVDDSAGPAPEEVGSSVVLSVEVSNVG